MTPPVGRKPIAFVINSIGQGGAERVLSVILASIGERAERYEVHLILLDDLPHARPMPDYVTLHTLGGGARSLIQLWVLLGRINPALVVSFLVRANLACAVIGKLLGVPTIICERMHLSSHLAGKYGRLKRSIFTAALRWAYRFPDRVLGVSNGVTDDLIESFNVDWARSGTIFNPYPLDAIRAEAQAAPMLEMPEAYFVAVGRLEPGKNVQQLLDAYAASAIPQSLVIVGDGALRDETRRRISRLGLDGRVLLTGYCANPFAIVARAEGYVSASLNEGFPNAMVEAMVLGRPVLASDCPSGPAEILGGTCRDGDKACDAAFGMLTRLGSLASLTDGLRRMADAATRERYARQSLMRAQDFEAGVITEQYWALFDETAAQPR